jgi:acetyl-CoA carboxylase biotin carboxyl carrier protein
MNSPGTVQVSRPERSRRRGGHVAVEEIHAEMVSSVWKVLVGPGAEVAAGDALVILESMKMEIPVLTEQAGTVQEMHVVEGEVLQEGDLIAIVTRT